MAEVFVSPDEVSIPLPDHANLLEMAVDAGVPIAHLCGGRGRCSTCRVRIVEGLDVLSDPTEREAAMAAKLDFPSGVRLACQTEANGSVRLWRLVLDRIDVEMASQLGKGHYVGPVGREVDGAAVMFADVADFTSLSESLPAYDVVHILNRFFNRSGLAIESNSGRVDNYMGDGLLAVFGIESDPDSAINAVKAGLEVLEVAADMHRYVNIIYSRDFKVRIGISLGEVIFGLMGAEASARETVLGDVVNTASRLESANKTIGTSMLVTEAVHAKTVDKVNYGQRFELDLPGKDSHVVAFSVVGLAEEDQQKRNAEPMPAARSVGDEEPQTGDLNRQVIAAFRASDDAVFVASDRAFEGMPFAGKPILLLHSTGARTGKPRINPLVYAIYGGSYLVAATKGGSPNHPHWFLNVQANPDVIIEVGTEKFPAKATIIEDGPFRDELYAKLTEVIPNFRQLETMTERTIPVVMIDRSK